MVSLANVNETSIDFGDLNPHPVSRAHSGRISDDPGADVIVQKQPARVILLYGPRNHFAVQRWLDELAAVIAASQLIRAYQVLKSIRRILIVVRAPRRCLVEARVVIILAGRANLARMAADSSFIIIGRTEYLASIDTLGLAEVRFRLRSRHFLVKQSVRMRRRIKERFLIIPVGLNVQARVPNLDLNVAFLLVDHVLILFELVLVAKRSHHLDSILNEYGC